MNPAEAAALGQRSVRRAQGQLRRASAAFAEANTDGVDVVGEVHLKGTDDVERVAELVRLARQSHPDLTVVLLSTAGHARRGARQPAARDGTPTKAP